MPTNQQRRDAERRRLRRQLEERRAHEAARKRFTLIASIVGTVAVIVAVVVIVVVTTSGGGGKKHESAKDDTVSGSPTPTHTSTPAAPAVALPTQPCAKPAGSTVHYDGLTVTGATDLKHQPKVTGKVTADPATVTCQDLVVGKGAAATTTSQVSVQYVGLVAKTGKVFQSSWGMGQVPSFGLAPGSVIDGFSQGIAGAGKIAGMHVGGRRIIVMPAAAAYGANPPSGSGIPANAALVFVVDLQKVS